MIRYSLAPAALAGFVFCASCATVGPAADHVAAPGAAPAALEEERAIGLTVGDPAPPLAIAHWVRGEEVTEFEEGKVYVVEFWATWCGPCLAAMPHLTELQQQYADYDVTIIGISDESLEKVTEFLGQEDRDGMTWDDKIGYTIALASDGSVFENNYMRPSGQRGIPATFLIGRDGRIEWIGHPRQLDDPLHAVVHNEWDREAARAEIMRRQEVQRIAMEQRRIMAEARAQGNWEKVLELLDEQIRASDGNPRIMYQRFVTLIADVKSYHAGYGYGERLVDKAWDDPHLLNAVAWFVVDDERVGRRDLNFAMRAAERAVELTEEQNDAILDTLARVYYERGELDEALKWQRLAVEHAAEGQMGDGIRETLEKYEAQAAAR